MKNAFQQSLAKKLTRHSTVAALVPHFRCEAWLPDCLESLVSQTKALDAIVVIDDGSGQPPTEIVRRFPQVTLLSAEERVGPYRLIQEVIDRTAYDAYLFQDADDWSAADRLELLLAEAERTGAELVGCQEVRVLCAEAEAVPFSYPLDVNRALAEKPTSFPLLHPTSLVSRDLVQRLGGFATGLRFGGDSEFLRRASLAARVVNVDSYSYFRRIRDGSLTTAAETGLRSPQRRELIARLHAAARKNADLVARGEKPVLEPCAVTGSVTLNHVLGKTLKK